MINLIIFIGLLSKQVLIISIKDMQKGSDDNKRSVFLKIFCVLWSFKLIVGEKIKIDSLLSRVHSVSFSTLFAVIRVLETFLAYHLHFTIQFQFIDSVCDNGKVRHATKNKCNATREEWKKDKLLFKIKTWSKGRNGRYTSGNKKVEYFVYLTVAAESWKAHDNF